MLDDHQVIDIYTGMPLASQSFDRLGPLSIDHFIPWSFVLHDELWNLLPSFRDVNSSKSDRLPDLGEYLDAFCRQQFDAVLTVRDRGHRRKALDSYVTIGADVRNYVRNQTSLDHFSNAMVATLDPLHQIARNNGFSLWRPRVEHWVVSL
ncbi:MAG: HNH endonuclease domain-containing protein [Coriobacteriia bacterium]|nr:HNH endonuclease domain-containing protein [Coriobacteriia bacterium]